MTAHILIPALDEERPATLSPRIVDRLLKQKLGFGGLVFTDDLGMKAISAQLRHRRRRRSRRSPPGAMPC